MTNLQRKNQFIKLELEIQKLSESIKYLTIDNKNPNKINDLSKKYKLLKKKQSKLITKYVIKYIDLYGHSHSGEISLYIDIEFDLNKNTLASYLQSDETIKSSVTDILDKMSISLDYVKDIKKI